MRGGEKVLEAILELVPQAEIFSLFHFPGSVSPLIEGRVIHTSPLQRIARSVSDYRMLLPLFPSAAGTWDFRGFDLIISSSHCVAKGASAHGVPHVCYCHTPMRYIWDRFDDYFPARRPLARFAAKTIAPALQRWDVTTSACVTEFVANSAFVRDRIRRFYGRDSTVVHPFADDSFFTPPIETERDDYHVVLSALVPYKRIDVAVEAARISGKRLIVIGSGPLRAELERAAGPNVEFAGFVSTEEVLGILRRARSLIVPGVEDFGITIVEAMACGTPVVAIGEGGALDSVEEGVSGMFFHEPDAGALAAAMEEVERNMWDREAIRGHARRFTRARFLEEFGGVVNRVIANSGGRA